MIRCVIWSVLNENGTRPQGVWLFLFLSLSTDTVNEIKTCLYGTWLDPDLNLKRKQVYQFMGQCCKPVVI